ncbi:glycosyltransferase 61 family protein [Rhodohalobacter sp.]|uniref:glycosyltransferase 61 family protein n=1 Tax=Rhodohalobacter sp. TaxID=1974210 RepID=UPI002ACE73DE|nr:glycosyltransferase 61 family protein [Rhodohalobacter sp.]MDZ7757189.1 glycosyltransferase 61 family protein [Rhodohalobacter sp.]
MQQAEIVVAPHGAAITNVIFLSPGTHVVEIADLSFPNPNFYALASAMGIITGFLMLMELEMFTH